MARQPSQRWLWASIAGKAARVGMFSGWKRYESERGGEVAMGMGKESNSSVTPNGRRGADAETIRLCHEGTGRDPSVSRRLRGTPGLV